MRIADVSGAWACFGLWGPRARDVLAPLTPADLTNVAFPYLTMQETTVGDVPVRALRVTYVGELGWELYCPTEYGAGLWRTLVEAGAPHGLRPAGYRAIESLRLEKGYRVWGSDVSRDTTPDEAGPRRSRCARATGTRGRTALAAARARGTGPAAALPGARPTRGRWRWGRSRCARRRTDDVLGFVTSGGYGYTVERSIAYALLPAEIGPGTAVEVQIDGEWVPGEVVRGPLYDPKGERVRA